MNPMVSVVMITYLHENFLHEAIEGILMQQCNFKVELIIADDNSPDNTENVVKDIASKHKNGNWIRYYKNEKNKGVMPNFEWALKKSQGTYIAICEGDDYWTDPFKLQKQVDFLNDHSEYVLTYHPWRNMIENNKPPIFKNIENTSRTCTLLFRNILEDMPKEFIEAPNGDTFLKFYLMYFGKFKFIENISPAIRRIHSGGVMSTLSIYQKMPRRLKTFDTLLKAYKGTNREREIVEKLVKLKIEYAILSIFFDEKKRKISGLKEALFLAARHRQLKFTASTFMYMVRKR